MKVDVPYAVTHLADLMAAAYRGEVVEIESPDKSALRLVVSASVKHQDDAEDETVWTQPAIPRSEIFGCMRGKIQLSDDWDSPETNAEIADLFEGNAASDQVVEK